MDFTSPVSSVFLSGHSVSDFAAVQLGPLGSLLVPPPLAGGRSSLNFCGCWGRYEVVACQCLLRGLSGKLSQLLWLLKCVSHLCSVGIAGNEMLIK